MFHVFFIPLRKKFLFNKYSEKMKTEKSKNPFLVAGYISPEYFCDREKETAHIISALHNGRTISLISPRRFGKTGLIHHVFCFYFDIFSTQKNKFFFNLCWLLSVFLLFSCQSTDYIKITDAYLFKDKSFQDVQYLTSNIVNDTFIGNPVRLTKIDTLIYVVDSKLDSLVHIFDIKNNVYKGLGISKGNGPNELLSVGHVTPSIDKKSVWAHDITSRQWKQYDRELNTVIDKIQFSQNINNKLYQIDEPQWISDNLFVCLNFYSHKERFYVVNRDLTDITPVFNPQFSFDDNVPSSLMDDIFSSSIHVRPDKKKVVLTGRYLDCIEIYNIDGSLTKLLKGPETNFNFKFDKNRSVARGAVIKTPDSRRAYLCVKSTNDRIYALYSGKERGDSPDYPDYSYSNIIYTFDWEGNLLKKYVLDCQIGDFDVDESTQTIYAINDMDSSIVSFNLLDDKTL